MGIQTRDGVRDHPNIGVLDRQAEDFRGNFVIIKHADGEYSHMAHFKKGSIRSRTGSVVKMGEIIGLYGNSGNSTEPHLHFHVQDRENFFFAVSLPLTFSNIEIGGEGHFLEIESGFISKGQWVKNAKYSMMT